MTGIHSCGCIWKKLAVFFGVFFSFALVTRGYDFTANGTLHVEAYLNTGQIVNSGDYSFSVSVNSNQWLLKAEYGDSHYELFGCDGTNVYSCLVDPASIKRGTFPGTIVHGSYPATGSYHATVPWLALASAPLFESKDQLKLVLPAPWRRALNQRTAYMYSVEVETLSQALTFPKHARYTISSQVITNKDVIASVPDSVGANALNVTPAFLAKAWKNGEIGGDYKVLETQEVDGITFPKKFEFDVFHRTTASSAALKIATKIMGSVDVPIHATLPNYLPSITNLIAVSDFRFRNPNVNLSAIQYGITNGQWPRGDEAFLPKTLDALTGYQTVALKVHRDFPALVVAAVVIALVAPLLLLKLNRKTAGVIFFL